MNKEESKKARKVMEAWENGAEIEIRNRRQDFWFPIKGNISWLWDTIEYRIAEPKPVELKVGMKIYKGGNKMTERRVLLIHNQCICYDLCGKLYVIGFADFKLCGYYTIVNGSRMEIDGSRMEIALPEPF